MYIFYLITILQNTDGYVCDVNTEIFYIRNIQL